MWKNFDELEENLSINEIEVLLDASRAQEYEKQKFAAALKGIDLDEQSGKKAGNDDTPTFEDIKRRAEAKARGVSEDQLAFSDIGIAVVEE
jgi:hypothetical protein